MVPSTFSPTVPFTLLVTGTDSDCDGLSYQFEIEDLTDGTYLTDWTCYFPSGKEIGFTFYAHGSYIIRVRSQDTMNKMSDFSRKVSLSGPPDLQVIGSCPISGAARGVVVGGNYAYIATSGNGLQVVDLSNHTAPLVIGGSGTFSSSGIGYNGEAVFLLAYQALYSYDVSSPEAPFQLDRYPPEPYGIGNPLCLDLKEDFALIGTSIRLLYGWVENVHLIDVSSPNALKKVSVWQTKRLADVALGHRYAYVKRYDTLDVVDLNNPEHPRIILSIPFLEADGTHGSICTGPKGYLYVTTSGFLNVINVQDPINPHIVGLTMIYGISSEDIHCSGNYLAIAYGSNGLDLFNVSDPANPLLIGKYDTPGSCEGVWCGSDYLYAADGSGGLLIFSYPSLSSHRVGAQKRNMGIANKPLFDNGQLRILPLLPLEDSASSPPK